MNALISAKRMGSVTLLTLPLLCGGCSLSLSLDPKQGQNAAVARTSNMDSSAATLVKLLDSHDPQVRSVAVRGLAEMGEDARGAAPSLHRLVDDPDRIVRYEAARALARVNPDDPALPAMLVVIANDERTPEEQRVEMRSLLHRVSPMYASTSTSTSTSTSPREVTVETTETTASHDHDDAEEATTTTTLETRSAPATQPTGLELSNTTVAPTTRPIMASERSEQVNESTSNGSLNVTPRQTRPSTIPPTTRPTTQPVGKNEWSDIPGLAGLADGSGGDAPPAPDINLFGYKSYTSAGAVQVRDWIQRQNSISDKEKQARIKEFQDWRYGQDKLIYQKVLEK